MPRVLAVLLVAVASVALAFAGVIWIGPLVSGGLFLTRATGRAPVAHHFSYVARHQGHVDTASGVYVREDDNLVFTRGMSFVLTRTYLSGYHVSREFGIGTTSNAEWYLSGDPRDLRQVELILPDGGRIRFDRTSPGTSYTTAMFLHRASPTYFYGARLGWTGLNWALRRTDGSLAIFRACSANGGDVCSLIELRDPDGESLQFRRDRVGKLSAIDGPFDRIAFIYDHEKRVVSVVMASGGRVDYEYDARGRLVRAHSSDNVTREYTYGPRDELLTIREPGRVIENTYDAGLRMIRQVTHVARTPDDPYPADAVIALAYTVVGNAVTETDITEYDGTHTIYRFNARHYVELEIHDAASANPAVLSVDRDPDAQFATGFTVRCTVNGRRVTRTVPFRGGRDEEQAKAELVAQICSAGAPAPGRER